jgi:hypothetical protein
MVHAIDYAIEEDRMKKVLSLGTIVLGCCLVAAAQTGSTPNQTPPMSTPSTFPQDQTGQTPSNPASPSNPSALPPDTSASPMGETADQASASSQASILGCLSRGSDGRFMLADNSGNNFQLRGDTSKLSGFVGNQVRIDGTTASSRAGAMSSPSSTDSSSSSAGATKQLNVSSVHKLSETCTTK